MDSLEGPRENLSSTFDADLEAWRPASPVFLSQRLHTRSVLRLVAGLTPRAGVRVCSYSLHHRGTTKGIILDEIIPEIGRQIGWPDIVGQVFRIREFDRAGSTVTPTGEVNSSSASEPYGYLLVESPILNQRARLPIIHRDDFRLASSVFDDPAHQLIVTEAELLVTFAPNLKLPGAIAGVTHALHYVIVPPGTLEGTIRLAETFT